MQQLHEKIREIFGLASDFRIILVFGSNKVISSDDSLLYLIESAMADQSDLIFKLVDKEPVVENVVLSVEDFISKVQTMTKQLNINDKGILLNKCLNYLEIELNNAKAIVPTAAVENTGNTLVETPTEKTKYGQKLAKFMGDVTIPDQTVIKPSTKFVKTWKFKNCGNRPLPKNSRLMFLKGNKRVNHFNSPPFVELGNTENQINPGDEFVVSIELQTPETEGVLSSYFRMADENSEPFGQKVWVCVNVVK